MRIAISMGDPDGIGPEITARALAEPLDLPAEVTVFGSGAVFAALERDLGLRLPAGAGFDDCDGLVADRSAGALQVCALERAVDAVLDGRCDALCTGPITKASAMAAGFAWPGHTEYLAARGGVPQVVMMLAGPRLRVVPLTGHIALSAVPATLDVALVVEKLRITAQALRDDFGVARPRIAVAGLNPHAGEGGAIGDDEQRVLEPAVQAAREALAGDVDVELLGPLPADALFAQLDELAVDVVATCYHDQGLIPFKMTHRDDGVNVTLGLPFVRTSPAHGSALDIAGRGVARPDSTIAALEMAVELAARRVGGGRSSRTM